MATKLVQTTDSVRVVVSDDGLKASLKFEEGTEGIQFSSEELKAILEEHGVVFGVRNDLAEAVAQRTSQQHTILAAEGLHPGKGKDGWIDYCFQNDVQSPSNGDDKNEKKVDYHDLGWIHNVHKLVVIAEVRPPEPGTVGTKVSGEPALSALGHEFPLKLGSGVALDSSNPRKVIATVDGNAIVNKEGMLQVQPSITVTGNVDYSTGDIDFVGSVVVMGDVKGGFSIKAKKSIEIHGNVEDATIEAGEDVAIRGGFIGQGNGSLVAGGKVSIHHVLNQKVTSGTDIMIQKEAVCAKLTAVNKIYAPGAVFVGCSLEAGSEIEVFDLGNGDEGQSRARVGRRSALLERINQRDKDVAQVQKQIVDVKDAVYKLIRIQLDQGALPPEQAQLHTKLRGLQVELQQTLERHLKEKESLKVEIEKNSLVRIIVHDTLFPNVSVELNGFKKIIQNALREVILVGTPGKIEEKSLE